MEKNLGDKYAITIANTTLLGNFLLFIRTWIPDADSANRYIRIHFLTIEPLFDFYES